MLQLPGSNETSGEVAGSLAGHRHVRPERHVLERLRERSESHDACALPAAAQKLVHPDALTWVIVGDVAKIEPGIRKLGLGEVKVLDADGNVLR